MELLLLAVVEFVNPLVVFALFFVLDGLFTLVNLLCCLADVLGAVIDWRGRRRMEKIASHAPQTDAPAIRRRSPWKKRLLLAAVAVFVLLLAGLWAANRFYFEPVLRWGMGRLESRTGIAADFKTASGTFWTGEIQLSGVSLKRQNHPQSRFDVAVDEVAMNVSILDLLWQRIVLESLELDGVHGCWEKLAPAGAIKKYRPFRIENFRLSDLRIAYADHVAGKGEPALNIAVDTMRSSVLEDHWLIVDLLFRSSISGRIEDVPFEVATRGSSDASYDCLWKCDDMPLPLFARLAGKPFDIFEKGYLDIAVENAFVFKPESAVAMDWNVTLRDFKARVPPGTSLKGKAFWHPVVFFLNRKKERLHLAFTVRSDKDARHISTSDDLAAAIDLGKQLFGAVRKMAAKPETEQ